MDYVVGDVQGCDGALGRLVEEIDFSPSRDRLFVLGDLVNRGPSSLAVLRRLRGYGNAAVCLLGNHDLHLLAVAEGVQNVNRGDTFEEVLASPERDAHLDWLRQQPLALMHDGWLMVHAGVVPQWDTAQTLALAAEVQTLIAGPDLRELLHGHVRQRAAALERQPGRRRPVALHRQRADANPLLHRGRRASN